MDRDSFYELSEGLEVAKARYDREAIAFRLSVLLSLTVLTLLGLIVISEQTSSIEVAIWVAVSLFTTSCSYIVFRRFKKRKAELSFIEQKLRYSR